MGGLGRVVHKHSRNRSKRFRTKLCPGSPGLKGEKRTKKSKRDNPPTGWGATGGAEKPIQTGNLRKISGRGKRTRQGRN